MDPLESGRSGVASVPPPRAPEGFSLEFDIKEVAPPATAPEPTKVEPVPPEVPKTYERIIDLGDGSGVQKFTADSAEALLDKLAEAQKHATKKIRELSRPKIEPVKETAKAKQLSEAERLALKETMQADPMAAFAKMFEVETGLTPEQFRQQQEHQRAAEAERAFLANHKEDFHPCPENAEKINSFLERNGYPKVTQNLEYAYDRLKEELVKKPAPVVELPPPPKEIPIPPPPAAIPASFGERVANPVGPDGVDAAELARISALPPAEMKARIEQLYRQGRSSAR